MNNSIKLSILLLSVMLFSCSKQGDWQTTVASPDDNVKVEFKLTEKGEPTYSVTFKNKEVIKTSMLGGFDLKDVASLKDNYEIVNAIASDFNEVWEMPWGEQTKVENNYKELKIELQEKADLKRKLTIVFRVYNDGLGFRYEFPEQENLSEVMITDENTQFNLSGNHMVWWAPGDWDIYEHLYTTSKFTEIDAFEKANHPSLGQTYIPENAINTPATMKTEEGLYLSFHEAALVDYSDMTLKIDKENLAMTSELVGSERTGYKVKREVPFHTPWRTLQIAENAGGLIESRLIVNLNEPNKIGDVSWFKPTKYTGIWWEMHLDKSSWDMASGKHGATTENAKAFIDFSAKNNIGAVLVEGWNTGWEHWIGFEDREGVFDFVTSYP
ncbi:MAG: glycoside hydrolase family 97 N-terminal domain-containing protein, partial [Lutibacter sp.]|nr:glycoside hydrolase family 97 N-terminal domain-containing protein [Lutibacter sp.]